jgi:hypothetical protein
MSRVGARQGLPKALNPRNKALHKSLFLSL